MAWEDLLDIYREAADFARDERERPPVACPIDGEPLLEGPDGQLFCRYDGWTPGAS